MSVHLIQVDLTQAHLWVDNGLRELERYLARHAAFDAWCRSIGVNETPVENRT